MKQIELPSNIAIINKENFSLYLPNITQNTFNQNIKNWLKVKKIIALKKGTYIFKDFLEKEENKLAYLEFLANKIYQPSYLSREYVLAKYNILSESVFAFTSVSLKSSREFRNDIGLFLYSKIKKSLFCGFETLEYKNNFIQIATKAKALFDYLYFYKRKIKQVDKKQIDLLRLNLEEVKNRDWQEFEKYLEISKSKKLRKIFKYLLKAC